ncbi:MAG: hypothetical protein ACT4ON_10375 [Bacteroidota bacterium]
MYSKNKKKVTVAILFASFVSVCSLQSTAEVSGNLTTMASQESLVETPSVEPAAIPTVRLARVAVAYARVAYRGTSREFFGQIGQVLGGGSYTGELGSSEVNL